jgi:hypothetical protein
MSVYKSLSEEQRKQLSTLCKEERNELLKRPQYFIADIIVLNLLSYFTLRGVGYTISQLPKISDIMEALAVVAVSILLIWLMNKWLKQNNIIYLMTLYGTSIFIWSLLKHPHSGPTVISYEYLVYAVLLIVGWLCSGGSTIKYFCEKIVIAKNNEQNQDQKVL